MKRITFLLGLSLIISCSKKPEQTYQPGKRITSFELLKSTFQDPPVEYRTAPFWVWNNDVSKEDIDRTLTDFKEKGIGGVFLHPRYGMITEYLSNEWWELVEYSLQKAEELDMKLWIYDENSFPSGFAGGHVAAQMPEANSEGVALQPHYTDVLQIPEELERVLHVFKKEGEKWIEITTDLENEKGKKGDYCLLDLNDYETSKWFGGYSYIDLLKPGVTEKFIEITMPGYEKTLGREFGNRVPGVFTDEPNTNTRRAGPIRYTPDLYEQFEKHWGYRLEPNLMSLITETGDWQKVRHNYQSTILQLFIDRWSKPWFKYTEEKNLAWTGHYWEHGWPSPKEGPDNMAMYAWHQLPGIDMLFNAEESRPDQFGNIRNVKELSSVVNQFGRHRALSETYGASGWELTFDDMKRLGDWEFVLGVNFMNQHLSYMSLAGDRKHDFPQSFGPHAPYWGVYKYHADYFARLSLALSSGLQKNRILVLEPTTTGWIHYNPASRDNPKMNEMQKKFETFLDQLEHYQVEYDLGCENIIKSDGLVSKGKFAINKGIYDKVIIPPGTENLDKYTFDLIKKFADDGGEVVQINDELKYLDGANFSFNDVETKGNWKIFDEFTNVNYTELSINQNIEFVNLGSIGGNVFHQRREFKDGQLLFLTNFDKNEIAEIEIKMSGNSVFEMNLFNGNIEPYIFDAKDKNVRFSVKIHPSGSHLLFISDKEVNSKLTEPEQLKENIETNKSIISLTGPNVLNLDYVELTMGNFKKSPMYYYAAANEIWKHHGFADNPWVSSSQFKTGLIDSDTFSVNSGFTVSYPFKASQLWSSKNVKLVVEKADLYDVSINGNNIKPDEWERWLDPDFHVFEIGEYVRKGINEVVLTASPFSIHCELEPVYLLGDFAVIPEDKGWLLDNGNNPDIGSWKTMGFPFYGQTAVYTKYVETGATSDYLIQLPEWNGTVAEVRVNGNHSGIIYSKPFEMKVRMETGKNEITVLVTGSNKNLFGPHHNFTTPGVVTPWSFKNAPKVQPPGTGYDLLDYGLLQDFKIFRLN